MESETMTKIEIQQRLDKIFANILHTDPASKDRSIYSSEDKKSIIVFFDNGIDPNPIFSGIVKGSIGLEKTSFVLQLYKDFSAKDPSRTTILKEDVKSIDFEFMMSSPIGVSTVPIWDKATNFSPRYIKINLNGEEEYVFWVNNTCEPITLKGKK